MNLLNQLAQELVAQGHYIPVDVASQLMAKGYEVSIDGYEVIDPTEIDYFDFIDQNH